MRQRVGVLVGRHGGRGSRRRRRRRSCPPGTRAACRAPCRAAPGSRSASGPSRRRSRFRPARGRASARACAPRLRCCAAGLRLPRLIQSLPRSSSSIAPRMRWVAKVSNCTPCAGVEAASASFRPIMPTWIRSSSSTLAGSLAIIWCARRRTSGLYCLSIALLSRRPLAVYMVLSRLQDSVGVRRAAPRRSQVQRPAAQLVASARSSSRTSCAAPRRRIGRRRPGRRRPSRAARRRESGRRSWRAASAMRSRRGDCGGGGRAAGRSAIRPCALRQQLHRGVGVGHAGRVVGGEQQRARPRGAANRRRGRRRRRARARRRLRARHRHAPAGSRRVEPRRVDVAQRQAARGEVARRRVDSGSMQPARSSAPARAARATCRRHRRPACARPSSAQAAHRRSSITPREGDVRVARPPRRSARCEPANRRRRPSAWSGGGIGGLRGHRRGMRLRRSGRVAPAPAARRRGEHQVHVARHRAPGRVPAARSARCTSACADRRCQSSGTRWPLATPTTFSLWRISASSAGPELDGLVDLRQHHAAAGRRAVRRSSRPRSSRPARRR